MELTAKTAAAPIVALAVLSAAHRQVRVEGKATLTMAHDVFISYSSRDKQTANAMCAILESDTLRCWVAPRDIPHGATWAGAISDAIDNSQAMVVILTSGANDSKHVMREVELAVQHDLMIVPFRVEAAELSADLRYYLSTTHWLDALTPPLEARIGHSGHTYELDLSPNFRAQSSA